MGVEHYLLSAATDPAGSYKSQGIALHNSITNIYSRDPRNDASELEEKGKVKLLKHGKFPAANRDISTKRTLRHRVV